MITKKIVLRFPPKLIDKPIIWRLAKDFDLEFNILKAYVTSDEEGLLVMELKGSDKKYRAGIKYLKETGVEIQPLSKDIILLVEKCTHCGACISICPTKALTINNKSGEVTFDPRKCIACELCIPICPYNALEVRF